MRSTVGRRLVFLSLCFLGTEGLLSSKTSLRLEVKVPLYKKEVNDVGAIEVSEDSSDEEEEVEVLLLEEEIEQQQVATLPDALGGEGDPDLEDEGEVFWTESGTEFANEMKDDSFFGGGDLEDSELNLDLSDKHVGRFEGHSREHDTGTDGEEFLEEQHKVAEGPSVSKDTATGIKDLESRAKTETSGGVERVEREAVVGRRMARDGEWMRVAEWVHYPALPQH